LASDGTCTANITNNLSNRNIIINGAAQINQRGDQTGITSSGYCVDRFRVAMSAAGTWSLSQSTDSPDGFSNSVKLDCTTATSTTGLILIQQRIEGYNLQAFAKGTSSAKQFAVSFYVKTNKSGVYTVELKDNDNSRQISKTFTVSDSNWNRYTLIFPADTTGAFGNDTGGSLFLSMWLGVSGSSSYTSGTLNSSSWATSVDANRVSSSNVNLADSTSNEFYLTGVQLEVGGVATDFEHRSYADELRRCQRYFYAHSGGNPTVNGSDSSTPNTVLNTASCQSTSSISVAVVLPVPMRAVPSLYSTVAGSTRYRLNSSGANTNSGSDPVIWTIGSTHTTSQMDIAGFSGLSAGQAGTIRRYDGTGILGFQAEL